MTRLGEGSGLLRVTSGQVSPRPPQEMGVISGDVVGDAQSGPEPHPEARRKPWPSVPGHGGVSWSQAGPQLPGMVQRSWGTWPHTWLRHSPPEGIAMLAGSASSQGPCWGSPPRVPPGISGCGPWAGMFTSDPKSEPGAKAGAFPRGRAASRRWAAACRCQVTNGGSSTDHKTVLLHVSVL